MIVTVTGGRNYRPLRSELVTLVRFLDCVGATVLRHGDCRGVDRDVAVYVGQDRPLVKIEPWPADWSQGPKGGPVRNRLMLLGDGQLSDFLVHFRGNTGTGGCIKLARGLNIKTLKLELPT